MRRPAQSPAEPAGAVPVPSGPGHLYGAALRHLTARTLGRCSTALRAAADTLTRLRWRLEEPTARNRAVASAALRCRCWHRQDEHRPVTEGGCTICDCDGFALSGREELDNYRASRARHPSTGPHLSAVPSLADGRFDLQFTHRRGSGHGASEGDPDL